MSEVLSALINFANCVFKNTEGLSEILVNTEENVNILLSRYQDFSPCREYYRTEDDFVYYSIHEGLISVDKLQLFDSLRDEVSE